MVGETGKRGHKYSFVHQGKAVCFCPTTVYVKDVNNLIDTKKSYIHLKQLFDPATYPSGLSFVAVAEAKFAKKEANQLRFWTVLRSAKMKKSYEGVTNIDIKEFENGPVMNERLIQIVFDPTKPTFEE